MYVEIFYCMLTATFSTVDFSILCRDGLSSEKCDITQVKYNLSRADCGYCEGDVMLFKVISIILRIILTPPSVKVLLFK